MVESQSTNQWKSISIIILANNQAYILIIQHFGSCSCSKLDLFFMQVEYSFDFYFFFMLRFGLPVLHLPRVPLCTHFVLVKFI